MVNLSLSLPQASNSLKYLPHNDSLQLSAGGVLFKLFVKLFLECCSLAPDEFDSLMVCQFQSTQTLMKS